MAVICGWVDPSLDAATAAAGLEPMLAEARSTNGTGAAEVHAAPGRALAVVAARAGEGGLHAEEELAVVWDGVPRWSEAAMARLAAERGAGPALLEGYRRFGAGLVERLRGGFALALVEGPGRRVLLAVDRAGIRPLAHAAAGEGLVFGSRASGVNAHRRLGRPLSPQSIYDYFYFHVVPAPRTIFEGIDKLGPAERLAGPPRDPERSLYWQPAYGEEAEGDLAAALVERLRRAVGRSADGAGRLGCFLSGGVDSTTVAGLARELAGGPVDAYSIAFPEDRFDESRYARVAARHFGLRHHEHRLGPEDMLEAIPVLARAFDEPFGNDSVVAALRCARIAAEDGIDTLLAGDGGDELFAGNDRYRKQALFEHYRLVPAPLRRLVEPLAEKMPEGRLGPVGKLASYVRQARVPLPDRLETYNLLHRFGPARVLDAELLAAVDPAAPVEHLRALYRRAPARSALDRMLYVDWHLTLADNDLRKVGTACAAAGTSVRFPLLDEEIVELSCAVAPALKLRGRRLRYFFKRALADWLPPATLTKPKHGFGVPTGLWLRDDPRLRDRARDAVEGLVRRRIVRRDFADELARRHRDEHPTYYGMMLWTLLVLEGWLRAHRD